MSRQPFQDRIAEAAVRGAVRASDAAAGLLRPGSLVILAAATAFAVGTLMKESEFPSASFWAPGEPAGLALLASGALTYAGYLLVLVGYRRTLGRSDEEAQLYRTCRDIAALVERETGLERDSVAVHVWTVRGLPGVRRLERRATFVPGDRQPTAIVWRKNKGVIGRCWANDEWILADLERLRAAASTPEGLAALDPAERFDFSWPEFRATEHYRAVLAWPLHGGPAAAPRVVGCLSIDVQQAGGAAELDRLRISHNAILSHHRAVCEAVLR